MDAREQKGLEIAAKSNITRNGNTWLVPSQAGHGKYKVDPTTKHCTCPDHELRRNKCKHIFAVEYTIQREQTIETVETPHGQTTTVTETVKVQKKVTYKQEWPAYNKAQTQEKAQFQRLLHELCKGVGEPAQAKGRPRIPLEDMLFNVVFKVYSTLSGRRFISDLTDAHAKGYISKVPHFNCISNYLEMEMLTPYLKMLIEESSLPLQALETSFAVDSSGFSTCRFVQWVHAKYGDTKLLDKREWLKVHLICGVKTNVVTSVEITDRHAGDSPQFKPLVEATAQNFEMREVSADKAYLSAGNLETVLDARAMPYIPFKSNSTPETKSKNAVWKQMYHYFMYNQERFMEHYHKRSNVESTFMMIKAKFGDYLRSKTERAQINEALCKVLCHNICCLIQSMFELGIKPTFWTEPALG